MIDLRSDTLTLPTKEMREAMYSARLGDDGRADQEGQGEDLTVNLLQKRAAEIFGKEDALLVSSGTMGNLVAILTYCERGDKVIVGENCHIYRDEKGCFNTKFAGVTPVIVKEDMLGKIKMKSLATEVQESDIKLLCIENTHNYCGGTILTKQEIEEYASLAHRRNIPVHLDGARIFNASIAENVGVRCLTKSVDSVMFCLSKGLSCPIGALLVGSKDFIRRARENRRIIGGQMRQAGIIAAAGIIALGKMIKRLEEDHINARIPGEMLNGTRGISLNIESIQTNIVRFDVSTLGLSALEFTQEVTKRGVRLRPVTDKFVRAVTYKGITTKDVKNAGKIIRNFCLEL